ncbi:hypothetical protein ASPCADRAFT_4876 [Aspergillus carbonarius ITEM 5010]|uniref:Uncharacterized protein n=1 Tax=Aspergillus carbonarius (strain ITEM 5010) TaxID=602072 RepID=A0A1R3RQR9_ASPC5|nr:hypothetical protein ASPCADRAFT_4876 [Aspergillus carbonarius ITEM 5010]
MKLSLIAVTLLGLAMATPSEQNTNDVGSTKVTDGTLDVDYCGERCEYDWECRRGQRCHDCYRRQGERYGHCRRRRSDDEA